MRLIEVKRKTKYEKRNDPKLGEMTTKVTRFKQYLLGVPIRTLHQYRETYFSEVKDPEDCNLFI